MCEWRVFRSQRLRLGFLSYLGAVLRVLRYIVPMRILWVCMAAAALAGAQEPASVFQNVCAKCHPLEAVVTPLSRAEWEETISKMVDLGAKASAEDRTILLDYFS